MKYTVVIGNPPYQERNQDIDTEHKNGAAASPLYQKFHYQAINGFQADHVIMIVPSKCLSGGKPELAKFRESLKSGKVQDIICNETSTPDWFAGNGPAEGHVIYHWNRSYNGHIRYVHDNLGTVHNVNPKNGSDIFLRDPRAMSIVDKIVARGRFIAHMTTSPFGMKTNFFDSYPVPSEGVEVVKCAYRGKPRVITFCPVAKIDITKNREIIQSYKVITAKASPSIGKGGARGNIGTGNLFILEPGEVCTATYLVLSAFTTRQEAENFKAYMHSALAQYMIFVRKPTQDVIGGLKWVPKVDTLRSWTDQELYEHFDLTQEEIALIESTMQEGIEKHASYLAK